MPVLWRCADSGRCPASGDRPVQSNSAIFPQQFTHRLGVDNRVLVTAAISSRVIDSTPEYVESLTTRSRSNEDSPKDHKQHKKVPNTKWAASTKNTCPCPAMAGPGKASGRFRETLPEFRRARPSFFGRHGDHADPLELQTQAFEELAHLGGTASQPSQFKRCVRQLRPRCERLLLKGCTNQIAKCRQLTFGSIGVPSS